MAINDQFVRGFGFAEGLHGSYAMTQGLIFGICLRLIKEKWWYCLLILPIFISIAFNARTGLIAIPISLLILFLTYNFSYRITIFFIVLFLLFYNLDFSSIYFDNDIYKYEVTFDWIYMGIYDFIDMEGLRRYLIHYPHLLIILEFLVIHVESYLKTTR